MPVDYKYIDHDNPPGKHFLRRWFFRILFTFLLLSLGLYGAYYFQTRNIDELILTGQYESAERTLNRWRLLPLVSGKVHERIGTAKLLSQGATAAAPEFGVAQRKGFSPASIWPEVLKSLWTGGRYDDGAAYVAHIEPEVGEESTLHFYKAGFLAGTHRLAEAEKALKQAGNIPALSQETAQLHAEINQRQTTGQYAALFDREGLPVVNRSMNGETTILAEPLRPLLENPAFGYLTIHKNSNTQAVLTLDYRIQKEAIKALGKYAGAIVVLEVQTGNILAAASSLKGVNAEYPADSVLAVDQMYEPGSIIKLITLAGALEHNVDMTKIFPLQCEGKMELADRKILYDWKVHGQVDNINEATAVSCNIAFARMGLAMKPSDMMANLRNFGFDSKLTDPSLPVELGRINPGDPDDLYTCNLAVGLEHLHMTPLHAAMLAASIANDGTVRSPRFFQNYRNLIGLPYGSKPPVDFRKFMETKTAQTLSAAMQEVVKNADGTGRRAAIEGFPIALKTGTAGIGSTGFNAVLIGFAPAPQPRIAFAVVVEHAGKAEFEGARVTRLFLESIREYI